MRGTYQMVTEDGQNSISSVAESAAAAASRLHTDVPCRTKPSNSTTFDAEARGNRARRKKNSLRVSARFLRVYVVYLGYSLTCGVAGENA